MRAFVTGSTGLLGSNVVRALVDRGWEVRALARSAEKARRLLEGAGVEIVVGDMVDVAAFAAHLDGVDVLMHGAAYFREYYGPGDHEQRLERINVRGTIELLDAAEAAGVGRAVYVSSSGVFARSDPGTAVDETTPYERDTDNLYFRSKIRAEEAVIGWAARHGTPVVLVHPGWMFGPGDDAPTASGRIVLDFLARRLPAIPPGGASIVDARDVAAAMVAAIDNGESGERYIVAGRTASLAEVVEALARVTGVPAPRLRLPYPAALLVAWIAQTMARIRGVETLLSVAGVRTMRDGLRHTFSSAKAERELDVVFRSLEETLADEVAWYRGQGRAPGGTGG